MEEGFSVYRSCMFEVLLELVEAGVEGRLGVCGWVQGGGLEGQCFEFGIAFI